MSDNTQPQHTPQWAQEAAREINPVTAKWLRHRLAQQQRQQGIAAIIARHAPTVPPTPDGGALREAAGADALRRDALARLVAILPQGECLAPHEQVAAILDALRAILKEPHGCPACNSGQIILPGRTHWDECGYGKAERALAATPAANAEAERLRVALAASQTGGAGLILAERERQVREEQWSERHDDAHTAGDLRDAAEAYLRELRFRDQRDGKLGRQPSAPWPWDAEYWKPTDDRVRQLVKAGALIAAEIDRLNRAALDAARTERTQGGGR